MKFIFLYVALVHASPDRLHWSQTAILCHRLFRINIEQRHFRAAEDILFREREDVDFFDAQQIASRSFPRTLNRPISRHYIEAIQAVAQATPSYRHIVDQRPLMPFGYFYPKIRNYFLSHGLPPKYLPLELIQDYAELLSEHNPLAVRQFLASSSERRRFRKKSRDFLDGLTRDQLRSLYFFVNNLNEKRLGIWVNRAFPYFKEDNVAIAARLKKTETQLLLERSAKE